MKFWNSRWSFHREKVSWKFTSLAAARVLQQLWIVCVSRHRDDRPRVVPAAGRSADCRTAQRSRRHLTVSRARAIATVAVSCRPAFSSRHLMRCRWLDKLHITAVSHALAQQRSKIALSTMRYPW